MKHQGELLKKKVNDIKPDLQEFANYLEMTTQNLYNIYKKAKIKRSVLEKCCEFLKIDITIFEEVPRNDQIFVNTVDTTVYEKILADKEQQISELKDDKQKLYEQLSFYQSLLSNKFAELTTLSNQVGELKTLLMTKEMSNGNLGKLREIKDSQPAPATATEVKVLGERMSETVGK